MITLLSYVIKDCLRKTTLLLIFVSLITAAVSFGFNGQKLELLH